MTTTTLGTVDHAAATFWKTDTTGKGHLQRGAAFHAAVASLVQEGEKKGNAQKIIAEAVAESAPAHEKKFGAATVSQYNASYALLLEETSNFQPSQSNADLYAVVHKAYAASMGVENLRDILSGYTERDLAIAAVGALKRPGQEPKGDGEEERKGRGSFGLKAALTALAKIQDHEWSDDEKHQLFEALIATTVAVQPDVQEENE